MHTLSSAREFTRHRRIQWLMVGLMLAVLGAVVAVALAYERERTLRREGELMMLQARVVDENLGQQLAGMAAALTSVREHIAALQPPGPSRQSSQHLKALSDAMPGVRVMIVTDARGIIRATSQPEVLGRDVSRRDYFQAALAHPSVEGVIVSPPFETLLKVYSLNAAKSWFDEGGRFAGIIAATLDPEYFKVLLDSVLYAPDMRSIVIHGGGRVLLSAPRLDPAPGVDLLVPGSFLSRHIASGREASLMSGRAVFSGDDRIAVYRTVQPAALHMDHPLVLSVSRAQAAVLAPWRKLAWLYGLAWLALALVVCACTFALQRQHRALVRMTLLRERESREHAEKIDLALAGADMGLWELDLTTGRGMANERSQRMLGLPPMAAAVDLSALHERIHPDDRDAFDETLSHAVRGGGGIFSLDYRARHESGQWVWLHSRGQPTRWDDNGAPLRLTGTHLDITQRKQAEAQIAELAFHDPLTLLPNRRLLHDRLEQAQRLSARTGTFAALLFLDLDRFKWVNDTLGHAAGDQLLQQVAERLRDCVRRSDTVARLGGDEFVLLVHPLGDTRQQALDNVQAIVNTVLAALRQPVVLGTLRHTATTSIGVTLFCGTAQAPEQLLRRADQAMYQAKAAGRNQAHIEAEAGAA